MIEKLVGSENNAGVSRQPAKGKEVEYRINPKTWRDRWMGLEASCFESNRSMKRRDYAYISAIHFYTKQPQLTQHSELAESADNNPQTI